MRPEERLGRLHRALNGMWTILSLILWGNWDPRKAVSPRPMLTQLGPSIVFNNWDSACIVVQREEGQVEQWYAQGTLSHYVNTRLAQQIDDLWSRELL